MKLKMIATNLLVLFFLLVSITGAAYGADGKNKKLLHPSSDKILPIPKPDLTPTDIQAKNEPEGCLLQVTVQNLGPGAIPDVFYHKPPKLGFQMYANNKPWGGIVIYGVDRQKALQKPGGSLTFDWFPGAKNLRLHPGFHTIKFVADVHKALAETNENNNVLVKRVSCGCNIPLPRPQIRFHHKDARGRVYIPVVNWSQFPNELFAQAPYLPPCGLNKNASRTWVDIFDADTNKRLYGFCALNENQGLGKIWVLPPKNVKRVYIVIKDRACKRSQRSNSILIRKKK